MFIDSIIYTLISQSHVALAVIQSIPIFDESKLFSIPLTKVIGTSVSFSYFLYIYLVLMFLGKSPHELSLTWHIYSNLTTAALILILVPPPPPTKGLFINFSHLYKQRKRRFRTKKRKANWDSTPTAFLEHLCCLLIPRPLFLIIIILMSNLLSTQFLTACPYKN